MQDLPTILSVCDIIKPICRNKAIQFSQMFMIHYIGRMSMRARVWILLVYNLAVSATSPTLSLAPYFSSTFLPWYFQNCLVAFLPATRLRILAPPGCSSRKSAGRQQKIALVTKISGQWMQRKGRGLSLLTGDVVHAVVDDYVNAILLILVLANFLCCERFRHAHWSGTVW